MAKLCPDTGEKVLYLECLECEDKVCKGEIIMENKCSAYFVSDSFVFYTKDIDNCEAGSVKGDDFFSEIKGIQMHEESDMRQFIESSLSKYPEFKEIEEFLFDDDPKLYFVGGKSEKFFDMNTDHFGVDYVIVKNMHSKILKVRLSDPNIKVVKLSPGQSIRLYRGALLENYMSMKNENENFYDSLKNISIGLSNRIMNSIHNPVVDKSSDDIVDDITQFVKYCIQDFMAKSNIIDFRLLNGDDLLKLGFTKWDELRTRESIPESEGLYLIPIWIWSGIHDGTELISITGKRAVKGTDVLNMKTMYNMLPWGFKPYDEK